MQEGATALFVSAQSGHFEMVQLLLDSKANIHAATTVCDSPRPILLSCCTRLVRCQNLFLPLCRCLMFTVELGL